MRAVLLSFACNNACVFCAQGKLREAAEAVDAESAVREAAAALSAGETVALVGGEPTLDERLPSFAKTLCDAGAGRVLVQTNGRRLAYRSYARALREAAPRIALEIALAGSTEPMHDYHTGVPGSFKQTVLGLKNARLERIPASVSCVVTRSNFRHLSEIVRLAHAVSATGVRFVMAQPAGRALLDRDRVVPAPELVAPYLAIALSEAAKLGIAAKASANAAAEEGAAGAFAGIGTIEAEPAPRGEDQATREIAPDAPARAPRRSLAIFGRPAPARREERAPSRKTGEELRTILPALFDGAPPRDVAEVVAAAAAKGAG
jgi:MoaA/NifB/PqqE/SkfB family radical SAM enzyme